MTDGRVKEGGRSGRRVWEQDGGGGGIRFEGDGQGGIHVFDLRRESEGGGGLVFSLGREDTAKLARFLLSAAGVKA